MKLIPEQHLSRGHRCAVTGRTQDPEGFFLTGAVLSGLDQDVVLSAAAVQEAARLLGWYSPKEVEDLAHRVQEYGARVEELKRTVENYETARGALQEIAA